MKVKSSVRKICEHCYSVRRGKKLWIYCKKNPRHKQRQGFATLAGTTPETTTPNQQQLSTSLSRAPRVFSLVELFFSGGGWWPFWRGRRS
mmetsp:Transcript_24525/g.97317  ORF Transcript_24525/g.97317 Transcript_24525/m.97317 type:complete len:90 (-) Transcript_24525:209-478(-)